MQNNNTLKTIGTSDHRPLMNLPKGEPMNLKQSKNLRKMMGEDMAEGITNFMDDMDVLYPTNVDPQMLDYDFYSPNKYREVLGDGLPDLIYELYSKHAHWRECREMIKKVVKRYPDIQELDELYQKSLTVNFN